MYLYDNYCWSHVVVASMHFNVGHYPTTILLWRRSITASEQTPPQNIISRGEPRRQPEEIKHNAGY